MRGKLHAMHGRDHAPNSADPAYPGQIHYIGDPGEPAYENGWGDFGTGYETSYFVLVVGPPGTSDQPNEKQSLEIHLAATGGATGSTIFTLPPGYFDFCRGKKVAGTYHDETGAVRAAHIDGATGAVVDGV